MIDPRIKGFMIRLSPSMLIASGVSFCLFALMAAMIASEQSAIVAPKASVIRVENISPPKDAFIIRTKETEVLPKSDFVNASHAPTDTSFKLPRESFHKTMVPFGKIKPIVHIEKINIAMSPIIDRDAILLAASTPIYPFSAEKSHIEGHVVVAMNVGSDGRVDDVWVVEASPIGYFEDQALRAAKKFKYQPRIENGKTVMASNLQYRWDFDLP